MARKKIGQCCCFLLLFLLLFMCHTAYSNQLIQQTVQIYTHFKSILGQPTWLVILRDAESGQILPYQFDIKNNDNFWLAFASERSYRITVSRLKFGNFAAINNFCGLENGILSGKSLFITLTGDLTPDAASSKCTIMKYNDTPFTIVNEH